MDIGKEEENRSRSFRDPVCGMAVDPATAAGTAPSDEHETPTRGKKNGEPVASRLTWPLRDKAKRSSGQAAKDEVSVVWRRGWMPENISGGPAGRSVFYLTSPLIGPSEVRVRVPLFVAQIWLHVT